VSLGELEETWERRNGAHYARDALGRITTAPAQKDIPSGKALVSFSMVVDGGHTVVTEERAAPPVYLKGTAWECLTSCSPSSARARACMSRAR
jgi:hypothetical protein